MHIIVQILIWYSGIYHTATIQKHIDIHYFKDKSFIHENTIAYLHKYVIYINHLFKVYYLSLHTFLHTINSCHIIIPSAYEWVSKECKCSGNRGADGGASSYLGGNTGGSTTYI